MRKFILIPIITTSILLASNTNLDESIKNIKEKEYTKVINRLNQLKETKNINYLLGKAYFERHLTYSDYKLAAKYLEKSKMHNANYYLGELYEKGLGVKQNINKAIQYYKKSNTGKANFKLYELYQKGEYVLKNPKIAMDYLKKAANKGYDKAQYILGKIYLMGNKFTNKDLNKAAKWLKKSTHNGKLKAKELWNKYQLYKYIDNN